MARSLPPRPNLDHLRRQAKALLAALDVGDKDAIGTFRMHLPAAAGMTPAQVRKAGFRLADAQSAIARQTGFSNWPQLARHVEQLRALEGTWEFDSLEVEGRPMAEAMLKSSRVLIDGDCFRSEMGGTRYEGVFNIDVEKEPHSIDIEFVSGPESGNWNYGIFELAGDRLMICLDMGGHNRPPEFGRHRAVTVLWKSFAAPRRRDPIPSPAAHRSLPRNASRQRPSQLNLPTSILRRWPDSRANGPLSVLYRTATNFLREWQRPVGAWPRKTRSKSLSAAR